MNEKVKALRQQRNALIQEMHDLTEKNSFPLEAQTRWAELDKEQKALDNQIKAIEATETLRSEQAEVIVPPNADPGATLPGAEDRANGPESAIKRHQARLASPEYRNAFFESLRHGRQNCSHESRTLLNEVQREARTYSGLNTTTGSQGGDVVPVGFQKELEIKMKAYGRMRANCRVVNTSTGQTLDWPTFDDTANSGSWIAQGSSVNQTNPTFGQVTFNSYLGSSDQVLISVQLLQDSAFDLEGELSTAFAIRLGRLTNLAYTTGAGTTQPTGLIPTIVNNAAAQVVNAIGSNTNDGNGGTAENSIGSDDLDNLISQLDPAYRQNAMFMMNWKTIDYLRKLKDKYGRPLWNASLAVGQPDRIYGYPFDWNADMATIGSSNSAHTVVFGDFSKYIIRDVGGITVVRFNEKYMDMHQVGFQAFLRTDGPVIQNAAFSILVNNSSGS